MKHLNRRAMVLKYGSGPVVKSVTLAAAGLAVFSSSAFAALDPLVLDTSVTAITTDAQLAFDKAFPILTLIVGLMIGMGLFKKFLMKSAS